MKRISWVSLLFVLLASSDAFAAQHWKVDPAKSKLGFTVNWDGQPFTGVFRSWTANIDFDPADLPHSHATVNVNVGSEASDDSETDGGVKGAEGFSVSQFPTAVFKANTFSHKTDNTYAAQGTLSLKGISRPVTLPFTLTLSGNSAHVIGKAQLMRTDFHVGTGEWEKPDPVAHEVTVNIDLMATKG